MCGILGAFSKKPIADVDKVIKDLKISITKLQERGDDATGIGLINSETGKIEILKEGLPAVEFVKSKEFSKFIKGFGEFNIVLAHTRAATSGTEKENKNNHPFYHPTTGSILIHNGIISSHEDLKDKYKLEPEGDCDSELILSLFDKLEGNIKKTIARIDGSLAVALYHNKKLHLFKSINPIHIITDETTGDDKIFYFTSKPDYLYDVFYREKSFYDIFTTVEEQKQQFIRELDTDELVTFDCDTGKFDLSKVASGKIEYKKPYVYSKSVETVNTAGHNYDGYTNYEDEQKKIIETAQGSGTGTSTIERKMDPKKFAGFIRQVKVTARNLSSSQKLELFDTANGVAEEIWDKFANDYSGGSYGC